MSEHTPGPWTLDETWMLIKGPKGEEVAAIHAATPDNDSKRVNRNIVWENANLITAAPELLAALESFLRAPSIGSRGMGSSSIEVQDFNLKAARAAIAKAKGAQ